MPSIAREAPDPKLDLRYPAHWGRAGHNSLYPYRPLAAFTDRLAEEERRRGAEADKRTRALKQDGRQVERGVSGVVEEGSSGASVEEQLAERLAALPENNAFTTRHSNYGHSGPVRDAAQEYGMLHDGRAIQIPFRLPIPPDAPTAHTELEVQKLMDRHKAKGDAAIAGNNIIKRVRAGAAQLLPSLPLPHTTPTSPWNARAGERYREAEGFPATDAGIRNAIQNAEYQRKWRRKNPGDGPAADSAVRWLARAERRLPQHALELQRMLGWRKAAAEMKRAEGDIASLRGQLGHHVDNKSGCVSLRVSLCLSLPLCACVSSASVSVSASASAWAWVSFSHSHTLILAGAGMTGGILPRASRRATARPRSTRSTSR